MAQVGGNAGIYATQATTRFAYISLQIRSALKENTWQKKSAGFICIK